MCPLKMRFVVGIALLTAPTISLFTGSETSAARAAVPAGRPAPNFRITLANGARGHLSDLRGHVVVLEFWASWCGYCVHSLPAMSDIAERYVDRGVVVIGINDEDHATVNMVSRALRLSFTSLVEDNESISALYGVSGIPSTVVIDANGYVVQCFQGAQPERTIERTVQIALLR